MVLVSVVDLSALKAAEREIDALTRRLEQARDELRAS